MRDSLVAHMPAAESVFRPTSAYVGQPEPDGDQIRPNLAEHWPNIGLVLPNGDQLGPNLGCIGQLGQMWPILVNTGPILRINEPILAHIWPTLVKQKLLWPTSAQLSAQLGPNLAQSGRTPGQHRPNSSQHRSKWGQTWHTKGRCGTGT